MISLKEKVRSALEGICDSVVYGYPKDFAGGELVCWRESENRRHAQADGSEYLAELNYSLEIFAGSPEAALGLFVLADEAMQAAGFRREAAAELYEPDAAVCHTSVRYRALADGAGNIYQ